jgi:hypothetical protein
MLIQIVSIEQVAPPAGKKYNILEVAYKDESGRVSGKKIISFNYPLVFNTLKAAQGGEKYDVKSVKEGDYWNWVEITKATGAGTPADVASVGKTATQTFAQGANDRYETKEERNKRQSMICKQSSLAQAVATLKTDKAAPDKANVLALAQDYYDWVVAEDKKSPVQELIDMQDDLLPD